MLRLTAAVEGPGQPLEVEHDASRHPELFCQTEVDVPETRSHRDSGKLFRIHVDPRDPEARQITEIALDEPVYADGLLLDRGRLVAVTFWPEETLTFIRLNAHGTSGTVEERRTDSTFRGPSTVDRAGNFYLVVNADFETGTTPFYCGRRAARAGWSSLSAVVAGGRLQAQPECTGPCFAARAARRIGHGTERDQRQLRFLKAPMGEFSEPSEFRVSSRSCPSSNVRMVTLGPEAGSAPACRCPRCGGRLRLIALVEEAAGIGRILAHLGLPRDLPVARPARAPPLFAVSGDPQADQYESDF